MGEQRRMIRWDIINIFVDRAEEQEQKGMEQSIDQCLTDFILWPIQHPKSLSGSPERIHLAVNFWWAIIEKFRAP